MPVRRRRSTTRKPAPPEDPSPSRPKTTRTKNEESIPSTARSEPKTTTLREESKITAPPSIPSQPSQPDAPVIQPVNSTPGSVIYTSSENSTTTTAFPFLWIAVVASVIVIGAVSMFLLYRPTRRRRKIPPFEKTDYDPEAPLDTSNRKIRFADEAVVNEVERHEDFDLDFPQQADEILTDDEEVPVPFIYPTEDGQREEYDDEMDQEMDLDDEYAPAPTSHVVIVPYIPQNRDEMELNEGDLIGIEKEYPDGWARGQNISRGRKRMFFPLAVVTTVKSGPSQSVSKKATFKAMAPDTDSKVVDVTIPPRKESSQNRDSVVRESFLSDAYTVESEDYT